MTTQDGNAYEHHIDPSVFPSFDEEVSSALTDPVRLGHKKDILSQNDAIRFSMLDVHTIIEDTLTALPYYLQKGYTIAIEPFKVKGRRCAVIQDVTGTRICLLEQAPVQANWSLPLLRKH